MTVSVIISTYNKPAWLQKVIWGYECQTHKDFELIIADDGSGEPTKELVEKFQRESNLTIKHVWHPDNGFQKSAILNKAILASSTDYLIFSDGDCIPRKDFVETHVKNAEQGYFLSGGYFMLPIETSKIISRENIVNGNAFDVDWLYAHGLKRTYKSLKLTSGGLQGKILNLLTPTKATWNGHGSSGWKKNILDVNGFNEEMQYGGQDRELGERLVNTGIRGKQIRYSAICVHLEHNRGYKTSESIQKNERIRAETRRLKKVWTEFGIIKGISKA
ncbi:MAG TPA: glycosyltransferase family 2 protein [Cyclobacteriaceae bacterium]|nr:glycosyltransferase family 2 protein [Cyclobacteriaceae bacterium]